MNRPTRSPARIQPPHRRRSAAIPPLGSERYVKPVVHPRPQMFGGRAGNRIQRSECHEIHPDFMALYKQWFGLFKVLDRPWKWLVGLILLVLLSIAVGKSL